MRTSTAKANGYRCPRCGDETTRDETGIGYVRHTRNPACDFEKGERDEFVPSDWHATQNRDNGSLRTGDIRLEIGDIIEIRGEEKRRSVTYVMGSSGNWHATFKGQGAVPEGTLEWRIMRSAVPVSPKNQEPSEPSPAIPVSANSGVESLWRQFSIWLGKHVAQVVVTVVTAVITAIVLAWFGLNK